MTPLAMLTGDPHVTERRKSGKLLATWKAEMGNRHVHEISMLIIIAQHDSTVAFGDHDKNSRFIVVHLNSCNIQKGRTTL